MSLPPTRWFLSIVFVVVALAVVREWNIRRHEPALGDWPRAGSGEGTDEGA